MEYTLAIVAAAIALYGLVSRWVERSPITGPMLFTALGLVLGPEVLDILDIATDFDTIDLVLTATLVIVLFTDAAAINSSRWRDQAELPLRLLGIGLPLMVAAGWGLAALMLTDLEVWEAALLATMLAPTDAALGKAVVSNRRVPLRIRQALNVESGLNDGIALPLFVVFLEAAIVVDDSLTVGHFVTELVGEVVIAVAVGVVVGWVGARLIDRAARRRLAVFYWLEISVVALAVASFALAQPLGGSGFIAAWVAGVMFGRVCRTAERAPSAGASAAGSPGESDVGVHDVHELSEATGDVLTMASFLLFGAFLGPTLTNVRPAEVAYAVISLVVLRLATVAISMIGARLDAPSVLYLGWFGPRGLATVILTIAVVEESGLTHGSTIANTALITVALSVVLHGATAWWGSNAYADVEADHAEMHADDEMPEVRVPRRAMQ